MPLDNTSPALDLLLINTVLQLELSPRDRRVAARRYSLLQEHLNRPSGNLAPYLDNDRSNIYAQGSRAIGATIVHGAEDDRFDLDAMLEFPTPAGWAPSTVLDELEEALQGFPDVQKIERCTRCVQLQFAFMHLDVTPMNPASEPRDQRVGDIFHSSRERREEQRHRANPFGFADWFNTTVERPRSDFQKAIAQIRKDLQPRDRIYLGNEVFAKADIDALPDEINPVSDAPQVISLKLMKRFLNLRYADRDIKRPPSVYLSKLAALEPTNGFGLCAQLEQYASTLLGQMDRALGGGSWPEERNPRLTAENFNDRWPKDLDDMKIFRSDLRHLIGQLRKARQSDFSEIQGIFSDLFGERVSVSAVKAYAEGRSASSDKSSYERGRGFVAAPAIAAAPATARATSTARGHHFHPGVLRSK